VRCAACFLEALLEFRHRHAVKFKSQVCARPSVARTAERAHPQGYPAAASSACCPPLRAPLRAPLHALWAALPAAAVLMTAIPVATAT
tara:strand:- start:270 stop:533 length:264 start_codon:yes stop_codon:yes gene_type:complete